MASGSGAKVLVAGESWFKHIIHVKGFDQFNSTEYEEGGGVLLDALTGGGIDVTYVRGHEISAKFPRDREAMSAYDAIVLSDIGANSFLLSDETFLRSEVTTNRLAELADYVEGGGGLVMVGGYLSFTGIEGRARYGQSPLARVLPVELLDYDDRVEVPEGVGPVVAVPDHEAIGGVATEWPPLLGYNRFTGKEGSTVLATAGDDPLLVVSEPGQGRAVAFASDCAPHWAPPEFVQWPQYGTLWSSIVLWAAGGKAS